jgi:hypothetical protein
MGLEARLRGGIVTNRADGICNIDVRWRGDSWAVAIGYDSANGASSGSSLDGAGGADGVHWLLGAVL